MANRTPGMQAAVRIALCCLLLFVVLCPAVCLAQMTGAANHSCCPQKQTGHAKSCGHVMSQTPAPVSVPAPLPSQSLLTLIGAPQLPAAVTLPPGPRPSKPSPPTLKTVLRI
jgi:hypothetical protein